MNRQECGEYLVHRLQQVGWQSDPSFDPAAIDAIFAATGGIPRRINTLCNRLLLFGFLDELHHFSASEVSRVVADFNAENSFDTRDRGAVRPNGASGNPGEVSRRMDQLEHRISRQETFVKRVAMAMYDFMALRDAQ
jgi:hypothetical protein